MFTEYPVPTSESAPTDIVAGPDGALWFTEQRAKKIGRITTSGQFTEYQLPHYTNVRRVFVDNHTTPPTFWLGNNHGAALIKVEPQD